jgi:pantoate--beta-alanine ligase
MGALHEGHISLVREAKRGAKQGAKGGARLAVVSVFVNPTQFNDANDLKNYPRTPEQDLAMLEAEGVDVVFMPSVDEVYPDGQTASREWNFGNLDKVMEGATRPGHFAGVAQVVSRLFDLVRPGRAFFGQKDFQQVAIIREMVRQAREEQPAGDNKHQRPAWADVEIVECPTVREADGLALSSRNVLLTPEHRAAAPDIYRALTMGAERAASLAWPELHDMVVAEVERSGLLRVIYFDRMGTQACIAVQAGNVRLIDNLRLN